MSPRHQIYAITKELDAMRVEFRNLAEEPDEVIVKKFHNEVTNKIKSLNARAENMEAAQRRLI